MDIDTVDPTRVPTVAPGDGSHISAAEDQAASSGMVRDASGKLVARVDGGGDVWDDRGRYVGNVGSHSGAMALERLVAEVPQDGDG